MVSMRKNLAKPMYFDDEAVGHYGEKPEGMIILSRLPILPPDGESYASYKAKIAKHPAIEAEILKMINGNKKGYGYSSSSIQKLHDMLSSVGLRPRLPVNFFTSNATQTLKKINDDEEKGNESNSSMQEQPSPSQQVSHVKKRRMILPAVEHANSYARGLYYKNMKWQAAIKLNCKHVHLGTFDTRAEATRRYDRAAFVCGGEPNFELSEEDKDELRKLNWTEFLRKTKAEIALQKNKKQRTKDGSEEKSDDLQAVQDLQKKPDQCADNAKQE